jgi:hypothetical protein
LAYVILGSGLRIGRPPRSSGDALDLGAATLGAINQLTDVAPTVRVKLGDDLFSPVFTPSARVLLSLLLSSRSALLAGRS